MFLFFIAGFELPKKMILNHACLPVSLHLEYIFKQLKEPSDGI